MRVLLGWLRELVDLPADAGEVARRLTMAGLEVEAVERLDHGLERVVVGEVRSKEPIAGTRLNVCRVFDGATELQIVCGAQNYGVGDHVPLAREGAVLPGGKAIGRAKLKGVESFGMLCGGAELGADDGVDGLLILAKDTVPGSPIAGLLGRDDVAFELNVTPNRADALSHLGVARELAALLRTPLKHLESLNFPDTGAGPQVEIAAPELCHRYASRVLEGVTVGPSPAWLRQRLEALGQRSINNVVDATNYAMLELGEPMHAFDLDRLAGGRVVVRRARDGEPLRTLDGKDRILASDELVIADAERPVALAGVMGGEDSEVKQQTTRLLLESAYFVPGTVRRTARRHGLHSEASYRFERGVDPELMRRALDRLTELILKAAGGRVAGGTTDLVARPHVRPTIPLRHARLEALLGTEVPWQEAQDILTALGLAPVEASADRATFQVPGFRPDLGEEVDLVEEVARVRGLENIAPVIPNGAGTQAGEDPVAAAEARLRTALAGAGFDEAVNYAFVPAAEVEALSPGRAPVALKNPLSSEWAVMRTTLLGGLLRNLGRNLRHGVTALRLYELGRVFRPHEAAPAERMGSAGFRVVDEPRRLALVAYGPRGRGWTGGKEPVDFYDLKGALELGLDALGLDGAEWAPHTAAHLHPVSAAVVRLGGAAVGTAGELHPALAAAFDLPRGVFVAEFDADAVVAAARLVPRYRGLPRFPASLRDLAVVVDAAVSAADVLRELQRADAHRLVEEALLFDVYTGAPVPAGKKNLAFSLRYRAPDRTLTDDEVNALHAGLVQAVSRAFGAELRA
jgi:phenylalanyl-tRNA synthetase beta chain